MKKIIIFICICSHVQLHAQNVGIKTTTPQSALDINGDITLRKGTLTLAAGGNNNVDISTSKYSVYDFAGGALTGGVQIYGFAGGTDGRIITIFNNSTISAMQLMDESHPGSVSSLAVNRIVTGSGNVAVIYQNGSVTLRYDGLKQRWTITGSNYTDGLSAAPTASAAWQLGGNSGTTAANFIGTTDNQPLSFRINNQPAGKISNRNISIGINAAASNTTGLGNIAIGPAALNNNTSNSGLVAIGDSALYNNIFTPAPFGGVEGGIGNNAIGAKTLFANTTGIFNTAIGYHTLLNNTTGFSNTATGVYALTDNTTGYYNTATGTSSLYKNTTGSTNTATGQGTLYANTTGFSNTATGYEALSNNTTGKNNTAIGANAGFISGTNNIDNTVTLGYNAVTNTPGLALLGNTATTFCGGYKNWSNFSDGRFKTNVKENVIGLDFIKALRPVTYTIDLHGLNKFIYKDKAEEYEKSMAKGIEEKLKVVETGFIAQEVEAAAKKTGYNFDGVVIPKDTAQSHYAISYASFVVPLVKAVQEQQKMIEQQLELIKQLQIEIAALKNKK